MRVYSILTPLLLFGSAFSFAPIAGNVRARGRVGASNGVSSFARSYFSENMSSNCRVDTSLKASSFSESGIRTPTKPNVLISIIGFFAINEGFKSLFKMYSVSFPSSLAGCGALLLALNPIFASYGDKLYDKFAPGAEVLAKWLPLFFVPSLIALPLSGGIGSEKEVAAVVVGGFLFSLFTTALSVIGVRKLLPKKKNVGASSTFSLPTRDVGFSDDLALNLEITSLASAVLAVIAERSSSSLATPMNTLFLLSTTICSFVYGARLPKKFKKVFHPLVTCTAVTWLAAKLVGNLTRRTFHSMLEAYTAPRGAGQILLGFLGPAVVSLACSMYERRRIMKENIGEVATAVGVSSFGGLFGTALAVRLLKISKPALRLSLLSRNITTPLAMAIAKILGADINLAVSMVVVTGLIGANFGASILDAMNVKDVVARGLGIGAASHGLGTAAITNEKDAFPFAAIAMTLTASASTVLVSVPAIRKALLKLALGAIEAKSYL